MKFRLPTDVQSEAIPLILGGGDVLMAAETGSGKTGAFCLPIIQIVWETLKDLEAGKGSKIIAQICKSQLYYFLYIFKTARSSNSRSFIKQLCVCMYVCMYVCTCVCIFFLF